MNKSNKGDSRKDDESQQPAAIVELESQFILRLPGEPAKTLREMLKSGTTTLNDRFSIKVESDLRYGEVRIDNWSLHAKVVDLPTIVESLKTIDNKSFYKTADICQIMICKEEDDQTTTDEESPQKYKKKDPNKVDKKFLYPHGVTPPLKNVRKRRFRKTLKKKYVEAPEIEKEVKRLLRSDNEAVNVSYEVISEEDEKKASGTIIIKEERIPQELENSIDTSGENPSENVAEHDIFGEAVSDSEDEEQNIVVMEDNSNLSADDSRMSDSFSMPGRPNQQDQEFVTEFSKEMFNERESSSIKVERDDSNGYDYDVFKSEMSSPPQDSYSHDTSQNINANSIQARMDLLLQQLTDLRVRRQQQEMEIAKIENIALRQRFQEILDDLLQEQMDKEQQYEELAQLL